MICENCGMEIEEGHLMCPECGRLIDYAFPTPNNQEDFSDTTGVKVPAIYTDLQSTDYFIDPKYKVDTNVGVKKVVHDNILKNEQALKDEENKRIVNEEVLSSLQTSLNNGEPLDIEFAYKFRKRFKAFKLQDIPGYDFTEKGKAAIPEELRNTYMFTGDYIMYAKTVNGCPIIVTDKRLYLNNVIYELRDLQEGCLYQGMMGGLSQIPSDMCLAEISGLNSSVYTLMSKSDEAVYVITCVFVAASFNRRPGYSTIEDRTDEKIYICLNCHSKNVKPGIIKSVCPVCGKISQSAVGYCTPANIKKSYGSFEELLDDNYRINEGGPYFEDDEYWHDCAVKIRDSLPEDLRQRVINFDSTGGLNSTNYNSKAATPVISTNADQTVGSQTGFRQCPACGKMIKEDAVFCNFCGTKIEPVLQNDSMFCVYCGKKISANDRFCSHCGKENKYWKG